jgi:hypothetical protein
MKQKKSGELNNKYLYLGLEHIESNTGNFITNIEVGKNILSSKNVFHKGDVLYGKLRPYLNKVVIATDDGICSTDILVLKTKMPKILKYVAVIWFFWHWRLSPSGQHRPSSRSPPT